MLTSLDYIRVTAWAVELWYEQDQNKRAKNENGMKTTLASCIHLNQSLYEKLMSSHRPCLHKLAGYWTKRTVAYDDILIIKQERKVSSRRWRRLLLEKLWYL